MKRKLIKSMLTQIFAILFFLFLSVSCNSNKKSQTTETNKPIEVSLAFEKVYKAIQTAISEANVSDKFKLSGIELNFSEVKTIEVDGKAKLFVSGEYSHSKSDSKKSTFKFAPPPPIKKSEISLFKSKNFKAKEDKFIRYLEQILESADDVRNTPDFRLKELQVEVEFTVTNKGVFGAEFEIAPVEFGSKLGREKKVIHSVVVIFENVEK
jgi:hypothetical protein